MRDNSVKFITSLLLLFAFAKANSQILINELDVDTQSTDTKEFIELRTAVPFQSLNGYVMVLFNGSSSTTTGEGRTYLAIDLSGLVTDENGLVLLGNQLVSPVPDRILFDNTFQNGADAVGIYQGSVNDFPERTSFATTTNLVDALVYGTSDPTNTLLLNLLGETVQYDENANGNKDNESIQLNSFGVYETKAPTPYSMNDATTPSYTGVSFTESTNQVTEGDSFTVDFTLSEPQSSAFTLDFNLANGGFTSADYTGPNQVVFPVGQTLVSATFTTIDDAIDEGDEAARINLRNDLGVGFKRLRDNVEITVLDNDFSVAGYGTPLNPTYGNVASTAPAGYYQSLDGLSGTALQDAITGIIAEEFVVRIHTYADITDILKEADQSPLNSNQVWLLYNEEQRRKIDFQGESSSSSTWNREHVWPRSRGRFFDIEYDDVADGMAIWTETNADSLRHGNSDAHHLRPADSGTNSSRGNQDFPEYNGPTGSQGSWHGDVARALFYMDHRYNNLSLVDMDPSNSTTGQMGVLSTLLSWHRNDPPDDYEMNRNNVIYTWQVNRNPFIDLPDLAEFIYGTSAGQPFTLSSETKDLSAITLYPNPSSGIIKFSGLQDEAIVEILDLSGKIIKEFEVKNNVPCPTDLSAGIYLIRLKENQASKTFKLVIK